jgi:hypothetical protein
MLCYFLKRSSYGFKRDKTKTNKQMNKIKFLMGVFGVLALLSGAVVFAQTSTTTPPVVSPVRFSQERGILTAADSLGNANFTYGSFCSPRTESDSATSTPCSQGTTVAIALSQVLLTNRNDQAVNDFSTLKGNSTAIVYFQNVNGVRIPYAVKANFGAEEPRACTLDVMQCSDGSSVSRTGPECSFAACPGTVTVGTSTTDGRKVCVTKPQSVDNGQGAQQMVCRSIAPGLRQGRSGDDVMQLQEFLKEKGLLQVSSTTSFFGPATLNAVKELQKQKGLPMTGFVGPQTLDQIQKDSGN